MHRYQPARAAPVDPGLEMATLTLDNVKKSYGDREVVHGVSCAVADGELVVVVGPSGCGMGASSTLSSPRIAISRWCSRTMRSTRI
jgi:ABC-type enterochelin transport system ATPase subunit